MKYLGTKCHQLYRKASLIQATLYFETDSIAELQDYLRGHPGLEGSILRTLIEKPGETPYFHRSLLIKQGGPKPTRSPTRKLRAGHSNKTAKRTK